MSSNHSVAFVQGGSRGIGKAIVEALHHAGIAVAFTYQKSKEQADSIVHALQKPDAPISILAIQADSADEQALKNAIQQAQSAFGHINFVINNAGYLALSTIDQVDTMEFDKTIAINVRSLMITSREALPYMPNGGRIINIGSVNAERIPFEGGAIYGMSKAAVVGLTKGMARDLAPRQITVNNIQPGPINTDMNPDTGEFADALKQFLPIGRYGKVEEIASLIMWLISPNAGYMTGSSINMDGGFTI